MPNPTISDIKFDNLITLIEGKDSSESEQAYRNLKENYSLTEAQVLSAEESYKTSTGRSGENKE